MQRPMRRGNLLKPYLPLLWRLAVAACVAATEMLLRHYLADDLPGADRPLFPFQKQSYSFLVAWVVWLVIFTVFGRASQARPVIASLAGAAMQPAWWLLHLLLIVPVIWPEILEQWAPGATDAWKQALNPMGILALLALLCAVIPLRTWRNLLRGSLPTVLLAAVMALIAVLAIHSVQGLWERTASLTFTVVVEFLRPFYPDLQAFADTRILRAGNLSLVINEACSGLEGIGLMLVFCLGWLWYLRRDFRFPVALLLVPAGILLVYLLNAVRIAVLFAIAAGGYPQVAVAGFHSQAGWIFFNATVFLMAIISRNITWLQAEPEYSGTRPEPPALERPSREANSTAAFLVPLLAVLATGMLTRATSAGFDRLYWMRLPIALALLLLFRRSYRLLDWRFSWRGITVGIVVFAAWLMKGSDHADMPATLMDLSSLERAWWITTRAVVGVLIVPIVEELAFRGFLMRRLTNANFDAVRFQDVRLPALLVSAVAFGLSHGGYWPPGILAGLVFGAVAVRTGRFGEAVAAHAVANALLAFSVLAFGSWELW